MKRDHASIRIITLLLLLLLFFINLSCETENRIEFKSKTNAPPVITSVSILPEKPNRESELNLFIRSQDPDRDSVTYHYQWMRNEEEIVGENENVLKSGNFRKGDLIRVRVTPSDGKVNGEPFLSAPVKILNSPPVLREVWTEPKVAYANDHLRAYVKSFDVDGDAIYYTYRWEKNGLVLDEEKRDILERGRFKKGDSITVTVTPEDREAFGMSKKSNPCIISNSPPIIVSPPPTSLEGMTYLYQVKVNDPDNDRTLFGLKSAPRGMEMDKDTGLIRWEIRKEDKGNHSIEVQASDSEGAISIQRYTLSVQFR